MNISQIYTMYRLFTKKLETAVLEEFQFLKLSGYQVLKKIQRVWHWQIQAKYILPEGAGW